MEIEIKIQAAYKSKASKNYPELAKSLTEIGMYSYTVDVATGTILYRFNLGNNSLHFGNVPPKTIKRQFNKAQTFQAVKDSQQGKINYPGFMDAIAKSSVRLSVVTRITAVLFAALLGCAIDVAVAAPAPSVIGWWLFEFPPAGLSLLLKISSNGQSGYRATQDNLIILGKRDLPEVPFWCDGRNVRTEFNRGADGIVQLKLNGKGDQLEGVYRNGDVTFAVAYRRVQPSDLPPEPLLSYANAHGATKDLRGYWEGSVTRGEARFRYGFKIGQAPDATFRGSFDSFETGRLNHRLTHATLTNNQANIGNRDLDLRFEGTFSADGETMTGKVSDGADSDDIVFSRHASPARPPTLRPEADAGELGPIAGAWDAVVDRQRSDARTRIQIGHDAQGSLLALVNNPEERNPHPAANTSAAVQQKAIRVVWKGRGLEFQGELRGNQLEGYWLEGKSRTPIVFRRVQPGE